VKSVRNVTFGAGVRVMDFVNLYGCTIGDDTLIGMGAVVLNGARIGRNCIVGAKALVPEGKEIPDNSVVMGIPGKVVATVRPEQAERARSGTLHYVENWKRFRAGLAPSG